MLFERRLREGLLDGSISLAFRRWKRSQVVAGRRYRMGAGAGLVHIDAVSQVGMADIDAADAKQAGFRSRDELLRDLQGQGELPIFCIALHAVADPDPREELAKTSSMSDAERVELDRRLDRLDQSSAHGAWTRATLRTISAQPGVRAAELAPQLGWTELAAFKLHVRKLKALGLTLSLEVGYRLSPRGEAYLAGSDQKVCATPSSAGKTLPNR